jgi:hypothetical protein
MKAPHQRPTRRNADPRRRVGTFFAALLLVWIQCLPLWTGAVLHAEGAAKSGEGGFQHNIPPCPIHLMLHVKIGSGEKLAFIDTGASDTVLDLSLEYLTSNKLGPENVFDSRGDTKALDLFRGPDLTIQSFHRNAPRVFLIDLTNFQMALGAPVKALLGMAEFSPGKLLIDREAHAVTFHHGEWRLDGSTARNVPLLKQRRMPYFEAMIGGKRCEILLDTGDNGCITLQTALFEALVASGEIQRTTRGGISHSAFSGPKETKGDSGTFLKGELMGKSLAEVSVSSQGGSSAIGLAWLQGFSIEIDFENRQMRYRHLPEAAAPVNIHRMLGAVIFFIDGESVVISLKPGGGPAQDAGIEKGDKIERLGEIPGNALNAVNLYESIQNHAGKSLPIVLKRRVNGETKAVTVKLPKLMTYWSDGEQP